MICFKCTPDFYNLVLSLRVPYLGKEETRPHDYKFRTAPLFTQVIYGFTIDV